MSSKVTFDFDPGTESSIVLIYAFDAFAGALLAYFFVNRFFLEKFFMRKMYGEYYTGLDVTKARSFTCHQQWLILKLLLLPAAWPFIATFFAGKNMGDSLVPGSAVTYGDYLAVCYLCVIAQFAFELIYRTSISPVSLIHHSAGIALAAWQVAADIGTDDPSNDSQFRLLILYGVFEVIFETFPHFAVIYYRTHPKNMLGCARIWLAAAIFGGCGTSFEIVAVAVFMWRNWYKWELAMKIIQPILHFCFMAAQIHGARVSFQLYRHYLHKHRQNIAAELTPEAGLAVLVGTPIMIGRNAFLGSDERTPTTAPTSASPGDEKDVRFTASTDPDDKAMPDKSSA